jgi:hypothetical protein
MAVETEHDVVTGEQGSLAARDSTKRRKPKGAHHAFDWEALEDPNVHAEKRVGKMRRRSIGPQKRIRRT